MADDFVLEAMKVTRGITLRAIDGLGDDRMLEVRAPFHNNILWNLGHIVLVQYRLCFAPSGLPLPVPENYNDIFGRGTSPAAWTATPSIDEIRNHLEASCETVKKAYGDGAFAGFKPYDLPMGVHFATVSDALQFHCIHEGIHIGAIAAMRKILA